MVREDERRETLKNKERKCVVKCKCYLDVSNKCWVGAWGIGKLSMTNRKIQRNRNRFVVIHRDYQFFVSSFLLYTYLYFSFFFFLGS